MLVYATNQHQENFLSILASQKCLLLTDESTSDELFVDGLRIHRPTLTSRISDTSDFQLITDPLRTCQSFRKERPQ